MTCRCKKSRTAAAKAAEEALEHGSQAVEDVVKFVTPRARHARQQAVEIVIPVFEDARERLVPVFEDARERLVPAFEDARERLVPAFEDARDRIVPLVSEAAERVSPAVHQAYEMVSDRVQQDVYPKLHELWDQANDNPTVMEASRRGRSAVAALRGDLILPEPEPAPVEVRRERGLLGKILAVLGLAALVGVLVVAVRAVLGSKDDGWSPAEPMRPGQDDEAEWGESPFAQQVAADPDVNTTATESEAEAEELMVAEGSPLEAGEQDSAEMAESAQRAEHGYGEGAYVGSEPPEGYNIKGNERSMKYHTTAAAGYDRTNADVWFNSEEAAQAAGFTRALR